MSARRVKTWVLRVALLAAAQAALSTPATAAAPALHVIPFPRTPDASRYSHIIFSSLAPSELKSVTVTGSSSGGHPGQLVALPDGAGSAFIPTHPFAYGEHVQVTAALTSPAAGTASGAPGSTALDFSFTVATPANSTGAARAPRAYAPDWPAALGSEATSPTQSFRSAPGLHPPQVSATSDPDSSSGDIFLTPRDSSQDGPMILDSAGRVVWFQPVRGYAANLEVQRYLGQPVLTWWQHVAAGDHNFRAEDVIVNRSYRTVAIVGGGDGYRPDLHEFQLTPQGTAYIVAFSDVKADLSTVGESSSGAVTDCVIQELDVKTDQVLWEWHMLGHVPVSATHASQYGAAPLDFCHMNSIEQLANGNLLVSARNTWSVYEIDKQTGRVIWTLGGRNPSFHMGAGTNFEWQHDAHLTGNTLTVFDDGASPQQERQSSAKVMRLDTTAMTASLAHRYTHSPPLLAGLAGSVQILKDRNVFVGWGRQPDFSEYTSRGRQIFNASLPLNVYSYRAYRFQWKGQAQSPPSLAISNQSRGVVKVYVSWNGATAVSVWRARAGSRPGALRAIGHSPRTGFETVLTLRHPGRYLDVQALNARGQVIGTSGIRTL